MHRVAPTTSSSPAAAVSQLARQAAELGVTFRAAFAQASATHHANSPHLLDDTSGFLADFDALHHSLQQHSLVILLVGRESPRLGAVEEILSQSSDCAVKCASPSSLKRPQRDHSGRADSSHLSLLGHELISLRARVTQCTLLLRNLIFCTILRAGFADTDRTSLLTNLHAFYRRPEILARESELVALLERLARIWNLRTRLVQSSDPQRGAALQVDKNDTFQKVLLFVGLKSHPLETAPLDELDGLLFMDYRNSVVSIGNLAIRQQNDFSPDVNSGFQDCKVTIHIPDHHIIEAQKFRVTNGRFTWYDNTGAVLLEHHLGRQVGDRFPWKHVEIVESLGRFSVSFTNYQVKESEVRCFVEHRETHNHEAPDYVFQDEPFYKLFQSAMRERFFIQEYEVEKIRPKGAGNLHPSDWMYVKVWSRSIDVRDASLTSKISLTIPVTTGADEVRHQEILWKWMKCKVVSSKEVKLEFKQKQRRTSSNRQASERPRTPTAEPRRLSFLRTLTGHTRNGTPNVGPTIIDDDDIAPKKWTDAFQEFKLAFATQAGRDEFMRLFEDPLKVFRNAYPDGSFTLGSPVISWRSPAATSQPTPTSLQISTSPPPTEYTDDTSISDVLHISASPIDTGPGLESWLPPVTRPPEHTRTPPVKELTLPPPVMSGQIEEISGPILEIQTRSSTTESHKHSFYRSLRGQLEIRLLRLEPGNYNEWACSLQHYNYNEAPQYEALSYCWGSDTATTGIPAGELKGFPISHHLWRALRRLRLREDRPRYLWIDAVCIDQENVPEKNHQISLMPEIYAHAFSTVVYIGDLSPERDTCRRCFPQDGPNRDTLCVRSELSAYEHENVFEDLRAELKTLQREERESGNGELWWRRLWCVQEFHQSRRPPSVIIGRHAIPWEHFRNLFEQGTKSLQLFEELGVWRRKSTDVPTRQSLYSLLSLTGSFHCSNPRDRIFALLGMVTDQRRLSIVPDYGKSVIGVLEEACEALVHESGTLDVLFDKRVSRSSWISLDGSTKLAMPSWMPDLTRLNSRETTSDRDREHVDQYNAGPGLPEIKLIKSSIVIDGREKDLDSASALQVSAVPFDKITNRVTREDTRITKTDDPLGYQHSPDNHLIYNSLRRRGDLIERLLDKLEYDFNSHQHHSQHKHLDPSPRLGWLMLDYLFAGRRSIMQELRRRKQQSERGYINACNRQKTKDLKFVEEERSLNDAKYVEDRWNYKISRAEERQRYIPERMKDALKYDSMNDSKAIEDDFNVARDVENLFSYARQEDRWYYLTTTASTTTDDPRRTDVNLVAPMRGDVLEAESVDEVKDILDAQDLDLEFYEYDEKARERDLFKTSAGFLGLGPSSLKEGDEIIVPKGSSRPWIIRPIEGLGRNYTFVGEAVVPNIMSERYSHHEIASAVDYRIK